MIPSDNASRLSFILNTMFRWYSVAAFMLMSGIAPAIAAEQDATAARINPVTVFARGKQSALLALKDFGRYAITVTSARGVALQTLDRMAGAGPGPVVGEPGKQDGRHDLFLDRGEYKILAHAVPTWVTRWRSIATCCTTLLPHPRHRPRPVNPAAGEGLS